MKLDEIIAKNKKREAEFHSLFGNAHKNRTKQRNTETVQANLEMFGAGSLRTRKQMEERAGYKYFYANDDKWNSKHHNQAMHAQAWNGNFGNAKLLTPSFNQIAKENLKFHGKTNSETSKKELQAKKVQNAKARKEKNAYLHRKAEQLSTLNEDGINTKFINNFGNAGSLKVNFNEIAKKQNAQIPQQGNIKFWLQETKKADTKAEAKKARYSKSTFKL